MLARQIRVLCVRDDWDILKTRCAVLSQSGYDAHSATPDKAEDLLKTERYDLVILSAMLNHRDQSRILAGAGKTPTLLLSGFMLVPELLLQVRRLVRPAATKP